jgi:acetyl esterase/lipase
MFKSGIAASCLALFLSLSGAYGAAAPPNLADVAYGSDPQQTFDLWLPRGQAGEAPLVVVFHGGGFVSGDKRPAPDRLIAILQDHGIAVINANYRLAPAVVYPAPMLDGSRVIQWARAHHAEYRVDPSRIATIGFSAGGAIALWLAFHSDLADSRAADPIARESSSVSAVITINAQSTYDPRTIETEFHTRRLPGFLTKLFGARSADELWQPRFLLAEKEASPTSYVHQDEPPALVYYTRADESALKPDSVGEAYIHHPIQGIYLENIARAKCARVTFHTARDYLEGWSGFLDDAVTFLQANLVHPAAETRPHPGRCAEPSIGK